VPKKLKVKLIYLDYLIVFLLTYVLLIDSFNGYIKLSVSNDLPVSISQIYKTGLIILILVRLYKNATSILWVFMVSILLLFPTFIQIVKGSSVNLKDDILKIIKYLTPLVFYFYFYKLYMINNLKLNKKLFFFIKVSYLIIVINLLLKIVGLGYSVYSGNIGSKGYFYAGNEISGVLIITYAIIAYQLILEKKIKHFWLLFIFTINVAFMLSSKTAVFGIILISLLIKFRLMVILSSIKKMSKLIIHGSLFLPIGIYFLYRMILNSDVFQNRILFFYQRMDIVTVLLSSRNVFFKKAFDVYLNKYNFIEKLIGVGQSSYEKIVDKTIEIEFIDIFFTYGFLGLCLFIGHLLMVFNSSRRLKKDIAFSHARLTFLTLIILTVISSIAGHIFSSGMAGVFIGYVFAIQHLKYTH